VTFTDAVRPFFFENPEIREYCEYSYGGSGVVVQGDKEVYFVTATHTLKNRIDFEILESQSMLNRQRHGMSSKDFTPTERKAKTKFSSTIFQIL
jgi:hypothetical protein